MSNRRLHEFRVSFSYPAEVGNETMRQRVLEVVAAFGGTFDLQPTKPINLKVTRVRKKARKN